VAAAAAILTSLDAALVGAVHLPSGLVLHANALEYRKKSVADF
jgi:hypothetical protein